MSTGVEQKANRGTETHGECWRKRMAGNATGDSRERAETGKTQSSLRVSPPNCPIPDASELVSVQPSTAPVTCLLSLANASTTGSSFSARPVSPMRSLSGPACVSTIHGVRAHRRRVQLKTANHVDWFSSVGGQSERLSSFFQQSGGRNLVASVSSQPSAALVSRQALSASFSLASAVPRTLPAHL